MSEARPMRDVLAEMMRRERVGLMRPFWADWCRFDNQGGPEQWRLRADHLIRLLASEGIALARTGEPPSAAPTGPDIYRFPLVGRQAERIVRAASPSGWQVITVADGVETVEFEFTMNQVTDYGGLVLTDHPDALKIKGIGRLLAAQNEIYRVYAQGGEPS